MKGFRINPDKKYVDIILNGLEKKKIDFYVVKGICEEILDYLGYNGRYSFVMPKQMPQEMHPGQTADISVNNDIVGMVGKLHPSVEKEDVYCVSAKKQTGFGKLINDIGNLLLK